MKRIKEIRIRNFKAFQKDNRQFKINGKNVLVFGNNGSGKSSLFWALYTFLQSSGKTNEEVQKYFKNYTISDPKTHQTLKNIFMGETEDSYVKVTSIDSDTNETKNYTISHGTINTNSDSDTIIQELNLASDFINYKLLHNFYRASHRQQVNLWPVFERDIFPFLAEGTQNLLEDIIKTPTLDIPRDAGGRSVYGRQRELYVNKLSVLNTKIQDILDEIQGHANDFIKNEFFAGKDVIRISLIFSKKFNFQKVHTKLWGENKEAERYNLLHIKLSVELFEEKPTPQWKSIERVQSFLNEAQLTRIAIGIRIGALLTRPLAEARFKILVLDDMLISLDLSNRVDVVRIILNKDRKESLSFFDEFQKFIFTHDKGLFNLIRRNTNEENWVYYNFNKDESDNSPPTIRADLTSLQKAAKYFDENEFENCGNELRKEAEAILDNFLDPDLKLLDQKFQGLKQKLGDAFKKLTEKRFKDFNIAFLTDLEPEKLQKIKEDYHSDDSLTTGEKRKLTILKTKMSDFLINFNEEGTRKEQLISETKEILDRVMNTASHHGENELYRAELKDAIEKMKDLKEHLR
ncbi:MAG: hypothetical protein D8M58_21400 [Calditrichaeota bacterium]|nr:MAG: hypothetical protein DWQ03_00125 [Calditrichota bacterium]MBL1207970.1 hypothetical protein [Calditrichota bacterium]NOG47806.1 AAA family ATPase [Calditrichota bacterium]